jgi:hypothetical protein
MLKQMIFQIPASQLSQNDARSSPLTLPLPVRSAPPIRCEKSKIPHLNFAVKIHVAVTAGVSQGQFVELKLDASGFNKSHDLDIRIESDSRHYIGPGLPTRRYCPQSHHDRLFLAEPIL